MNKNIPDSDISKIAKAINEMDFSVDDSMLDQQGPGQSKGGLDDLGPESSDLGPESNDLGPESSDLAGIVSQIKDLLGQLESALGGAQPEVDDLGPDEGLDNDLDAGMDDTGPIDDLGGEF